MIIFFVRQAMESKILASREPSPYHLNETKFHILSSSEYLIECSGMAGFIRILSNIFS